MYEQDNKLLRDFMESDEINLVIPFTYHEGEELPTSNNIATRDNAEDEVREELEEGVINSAEASITLLDYHNDWNMLMEVVERIEESYAVDIFGNAVSICDIKNSRMIVGRSSKGVFSKILAVHAACVEFVKWLLKH